ADELEVDSGYELAVAAALDGRLEAAVVADRAAATELLDRAGAEGGRALIAATGAEPGAAAGLAPALRAERLAGHVRGDGPAAGLARSLLRDAWVVESLEDLLESFHGVAVTRAGRVFSAPMSEFRQAPRL